MSFTQPAFIRKNTPELRKKLTDLGYKVFPNFIYFPCLSCSNGYAIPADNLNRDGNFDCKDNENLFLALAALRDDSDYMQWFVWGKRWMLWKCDCNPHRTQSTTGISSVFLRGHKATAEEIIEHFKENYEIL